MESKNFDIFIPQMEDVQKLRKYFQSMEESRTVWNEAEEKTNLNKIIQNARKFLLNGKLELFLMKINKQTFLEYFEQFCEIENLDQILSAVSFSLSLIDKDSNEFISFNKVGYEIIFSKERNFSYYYDSQAIYYFFYLPVNFDTSQLIVSNLKIKGVIQFDIDKQRIDHLFYKLKSNLKEEERFSSMIFNLKHYFTSQDEMQTSFNKEIDDIRLVEPYRFELAINQSVKRAFLTFQIENTLKNPATLFQIVDSDIIIDELFEFKNGKFVKGNNKILDLVDYFIYNKNVIQKEDN